MKNAMKVLLFPMAIYLATYYTCYQIFSWAVIDEDSPWTRSVNGGYGINNPIEDAMKFIRDLVKGG